MIVNIYYGSQDIYSFINIMLKITIEYNNQIMGLSDIVFHYEQFTDIKNLMSNTIIFKNQYPNYTINDDHLFH